MTDTSPTLLQRLRQADDPAAWERFVDLYTPALYGWARALGLQENDAADLTQEVFAIVLRELPVFVYDPRKSFRAWLKTVALNHWRAAGRKRQAPTAGAAGLAEQAAAEAEAFWEEEYRQALAGRALALMQAEFEEPTWRACWLTVAEGKTAAEAAALLGSTPGAVRVAKMRVLQRLKKEFGELLD